MIVWAIYNPFYLWTASLLLLLCSLYFFYITGKAFLFFINANELRQERFIHTFFSITVGWILVIILYAIIKSAGLTIMLLFFIPLLWLLYAVKKKNIPQLSFIFKWESGWWILVAFIFLSIQFIQLIKFNSAFLFYIQNWDYSYYANFIEALQKTGIENTHGPAVFYEQSLTGTTPYHYADLWTGALFSDLSGLPPIVSLRLFVYSFFEILFFLGILAVWDSYVKVTTREIIQSFYLMFVGGIFLSVYELIPFMSTVKYLADNHLMGYGNVKYGPLFVAIISSFLLYKLKYKKVAYTVWLMLPLFFISLLPAISGGIILLGLYQIVIEKKRIELFYWCMPAFLYSGVGFFYILTSAPDNSSVSSSNELLLLFVSDLSIGKALRILFEKLLVCFVLFPAKYLLSVLPWVIWLVWQFGWKDLKQVIRAHNNIILLVLLSLISGLFGFWLWYVNVDAQQLFSNLAYPVVNIAIIVLIVFLWIHNRITKAGIIAMIIIFCYMIFSDIKFIRAETVKYNSKYSDQYLIELQKLAKKIPQSGGVFLSGKDYYDSLNIFTYKPTQHIEGYYLPMMNVHTPFTLSVFEMPLLAKKENNMNQRRFMRSSYFYRYCESKHIIHQPDSIEKAMINFIRENHLRYVVVGKGAIVPVKISEMCDTCISDYISGEKFCILKDE